MSEMLRALRKVLCRSHVLPVREVVCILAEHSPVSKYDTPYPWCARCGRVLVDPRVE